MSQEFRYFQETLMSQDQVANDCEADENTRYIRVDMSMQNERMRGAIEQISLPDSIGETTRTRMIAECCINMLQKTVQGMSKSQKGFRGLDQLISKGDEMNIEFLAGLRQITDVLQYISNCHTYQSGKVVAYDIIEITNRLGYAVNSFTHAQRRYNAIMAEEEENSDS